MKKVINLCIVTAVLLFVAALVVAQEGDAEAELTETEALNMEAVRAGYEDVFVNQNADGVDAFVKENATWCVAAGAFCAQLTNSNRESWVRNLFSAFPDAEINIDEIVASGDTVIIELHGEGTFSKNYQEVLTGKTLAPTNKKEEWSWIVVTTLEDGMVVRERWYWYFYGWPIKPEGT
jgi:predicted ester cyclase